MKPAKEYGRPTIDLYLREIKDHDFLTKEQEIALGKRAMRGDRKARNSLVEHNLRYTFSLARKYFWGGEETHDLDIIQQANVGAIEAARTFDPSKGPLHAWIRKKVFASVYDFFTQMEYPYSVSQDEYIRRVKTRRARRKFQAANAREPTSEEITVLLNNDGEDISLDTVEGLLKRMEGSFSNLDSKVAGSKESYKNAVPGEDGRDIFDKLEYDTLSDLLGFSLDQLTSRQREAICLFYLEGLSRQQIGDRHGKRPKTVSNWLHDGRKELESILRGMPVFAELDLPEILP